MTATYKRLASYFLQRDLTTTVPGGGYYYGGSSETTVLDDFNSNFNSLRLDVEFNPSPNSVVGVIAPQPDGKIIIGGSFTNIGGVNRDRIARLNSDGTTDANFSANTNDSVYSVALQPDGKILVGGDFTTIDAFSRNRIALLFKSGQIDQTFNVSINGLVREIIIQPDGKILVAGNFTTVNGTTRNRIARLNSDYTLDTGFNPNANANVYSMALQPDGKILVGGVFTTIGGTNRNYIARLNNDGLLDINFDPNANNYVQSIALQPDGDILVGGNFSSIKSYPVTQIARLESSYGFVDQSFVPNIQRGTSSNLQVNNIAVQQDGKIIIGGWFSHVNSVENKDLARLNVDGTLDANFNAQIIGTNAFTNIYAISIQPDQKILVGGEFTGIIGTSTARLARLKEVVNNAPYRLAYTVPANTKTIIKNIFATNHNDFPVFHDIAILPETDDQEGISEKHYYVWDSLIDGNEYEKIDSSVTLSAGDEIYVYSSTDEDISFNIFGVEITE
jgi:uncharacterized delta-60 repeat protein